MTRATTLLVLCVGGLLALGLVTLSSVGLYMSMNPHMLAVGQVRDPRAIAARLAEPDDPACEFIAASLSVSGRWALSEADSPTGDFKAVRRILADELNTVIGGQLIYDPERFARTPLRPEIAQQLSRTPFEGEISRANRLLLEDIFPREISRKQPESPLKKQLIWAVVAIAFGVGAASIDYRKLKPYSWVIAVVAFAALVLVFFPGAGKRMNGATRWLDLRVFDLQPSEIAKLALIIAIASYCESARRQIGGFLRGAVYPGLIITPFLVAVVREPDFGTTVLLASVSLAMLLLAGGPARWLIPAAVAGAALMGWMISRDPVRLARLMAFVDLEAHKTGVGYQNYQALLAFGAGGWQGLGLGNGLQKLGCVPENHTDFILSVVGEELGLIATVAVVAAFIIVFISGLYIASHSSDRFGFLLGAGISFLIGFQALINIAVVTSSVPNKGLPLPFVSYGGSSLVMMFIAVGLLLSIARHANAPESVSAALLADRELPAT
jgi:cell division protein FtsW